MTDVLLLRKLDLSVWLLIDEMTLHVLLKWPTWMGPTESNLLLVNNRGLRRWISIVNNLVPRVTRCIYQLFIG